MVFEKKVMCLFTTLSSQIIYEKIENQVKDSKEPREECVNDSQQCGCIFVASP